MCFSKHNLGSLVYSSILNAQLGNCDIVSDQFISKGTWTVNNTVLLLVFLEWTVKALERLWLPSRAGALKLRKQAAWLVKSVYQLLGRVRNNRMGETEMVNPWGHAPFFPGVSAGRGNDKDRVGRVQAAGTPQQFPRTMVFPIMQRVARGQVHDGFHLVSICYRTAAWHLHDCLFML